MLNSKVLIDHLLRKEAADRIGLYENVWPDTQLKWVGEGYPLNSEDEKPANPADVFDLDLFRIIKKFDTKPLQGLHQVIEENDEWVSARDGAGALLKHWKHKSGTPEHLDFLMNSREIWEADYRTHLLSADRNRLDIEGTKNELNLRRLHGFWSCYWTEGLWETMRGCLGDVCMLESIVFDPEWIHDFNRVYTDFFINHFRILIEEAGKPDGVWISDDIAYNNGLFCSPKQLEEFFLPYYRQLTEFFHSYDMPVILHSCGRVEKALDIIVDAGFDAIHPMQRKAGCDPLKFAERFSDKLAFIGGLDVMVLEAGDKESIRGEVIQLIEGMKARGAKYIFASDHSISTNVSFENYKYALEIYNEHKFY